MHSANVIADPKSVLAIIFGASRWEQFPGLDNEEAVPAYRAAALKFQAYFRSERGLGLPQSNILDLFDRRLSAIDQDRAIRDFLRGRCKDGNPTDVIVVFIGHGSTLTEKRFIFVLRSTNRDQREITAYSSQSLARSLRDEAATLRKWLILDCCAAAAAHGDLTPSRSTAEILNEEAETIFPSSGTAMLAACSADSVANANIKKGCLIFTAALIDVLEKGDTRSQGPLTLARVAGLVQMKIRNTYGPDGARPEVSDPDQRWGELSEILFFPNLALKGERSSASETHRTIINESKARIWKLKLFRWNILLTVASVLILSFVGTISFYLPTHRAGPPFPVIKDGQTEYTISVNESKMTIDRLYLPKNFTLKVAAGIDEVDWAV